MRDNREIIKKQIEKLEEELLFIDQQELHEALVLLKRRNIYLTEDGSDCCEESWDIKEVLERPMDWTMTMNSLTLLVREIKGEY